MLEDYFCIEISGEHILSVPLLLDQHVPNMALLPDFIVRVCTEVDWNLEQPCLEGIAREVCKVLLECRHRKSKAKCERSIRMVSKSP